MPDFHHFSICNQNQSISNLVIFGQNTKAIALLFGQKCLIFITFQSAIKINQFQIWSFLGKIPRLQPYFLAKNASFSSLFNLQKQSINLKLSHFWAKYQGYSLTVWPKMPHFHHFSLCNQNQLSTYLVSFGQNTKDIALLFGHKCLIFVTFQSAIKIHQFKFGHFWQNTKAIASRFGHNCLIFITFQSAIKFNQFQIWSFLGKIPRLQPYFLAKNASFSSLFNLQSKSINFKIWSFLGKIPWLQPYCLAKNASCSSLSNLQSKSIKYIFGKFWANYQGYSLTFWPKMPHFHHFSICNQNQSILKCGQFWAKYQGYSLTFWPKIPHFHHFSICNQNQSISNLVIFGQNTKAIALLLGQKCLIFITFQSAIKINQFQSW